jgi:hypothetical protein
MRLQPIVLGSFAILVAARGADDADLYIPPREDRSAEA